MKDIGDVANTLELLAAAQSFAVAARRHLAAVQVRLCGDREEFNVALEQLASFLAGNLRGSQLFDGRYDLRVRPDSRGTPPAFARWYTASRLDRQNGRSFHVRVSPRQGGEPVRLTCLPHARPAKLTLSRSKRGGEQVSFTLPLPAGEDLRSGIRSLNRVLALLDLRAAIHKQTVTLHLLDATDGSAVRASIENSFAGWNLDNRASAGTPATVRVDGVPTSAANGEFWGRTPAWFARLRPGRAALGREFTLNVRGGLPIGITPCQGLGWQTTVNSETCIRLGLMPFVAGQLGDEALSIDALRCAAANAESSNGKRSCRVARRARRVLNDLSILIELIGQTLQNVEQIQQLQRQRSQMSIASAA